MMWSLGFFCFLLGASYAAEVCYDGLGCFNDFPPWGGTAERPASTVPWHPDEIGTRFLLFTTKNRYYQDIKPDESIEVSNYSGRRKTRFVIPGYLVKGDEDWPQIMCKAVVQKENVNCIAIEWKRGVKTGFTQAVHNARVVAAQVESMITFLMGKYNQKAESFHIIGHCLGAHAAGEVGSRIPGLARISGLDPTEPYFQGTNASVRLDTSDATFVDVIHTDGLSFRSKRGLGMTESVGHIDFYPNGGELMPGCSSNKYISAQLDSIWEGTSRFDPCNHQRAYEYYTESIAKPQGFAGFPCSDQDSFAAGKCFPCADSECPLMGHRADQFTLTDGISKTKYFLTTGRKSPFDRYSYRVTVTLDGPWLPNAAFLYVALAGRKSTTEEVRLHMGLLRPGQKYSVLMDADIDVGVVTEVKFRWNNYHVDLLKPKYGASTVELQRGRDQETSVFCGTGTVQENVVQSVLPCPV
ncbi:inactive pancreatic lipase-related protein 1-like isoform X2 [Cololabis saira]|nr:inactive pancreatic lipase-related protein 1-like isoform X2 [Cololabis saira]